MGIIFDILYNNCTKENFVFNSKYEGRRKYGNKSVVTLHYHPCVVM